MSRSEPQTDNSSNAILIGVAIAVAIAFMVVLAVLFVGFVGWVGVAEVTSGSGPVEPAPTMPPQ